MKLNKTKPGVNAFSLSCFLSCTFVLYTCKLHCTLKLKDIKKKKKKSPKEEANVNKRHSFKPALQP